MTGAREGRPPRWLWVGLLAILALGAVAGAFSRWPLWSIAELTSAQLALGGIHGHVQRVDGVEVRYLEGGTGPAVLFVHGLGGGAQNWSQLMPLVMRAGHHVLALDLPGFGETEKPLGRAYSIKEQAHFLASFLDAVHVPRASVAGQSMGGWIAATFALEFPQRVERLVLMDSAGFAFRPSFDTDLFMPGNATQVDGLLAILTPRPPVLPTFIKEDFVRHSAKQAWVIRRVLQSMETGEDVLDGRFSMLTMPMLLVWGREDRIVPLALGEAMHQAAPQSVLAVYGDCGHLAPANCAGQIAPDLISFLAGKGPPPGSTVRIPPE